MSEKKKVNLDDDDSYFFSFLSPSLSLFCSFSFTFELVRARSAMSSPSPSCGEGTGAGASTPTLARSDGGRPPPAPSSAIAAAAAADHPSALRVATVVDRVGGASAAAPAAAPASPKTPHQRGRNPFESRVLNTYALPGTEHATWRRWLLELGLFLGLALAVLGPAVGLAVMTPYISVTSGLASDLRKDADCLKVAPEV